MELLAARIGTAISYCHPYTPTQKAKIERWFRTMKDQWMASLDMRDFHSLDELRGSLYAFVRQYNQAPHSSLSGRSPQERFFSEPELIRRLPDDLIIIPRFLSFQIHQPSGIISDSPYPMNLTLVPSYSPMAAFCVIIGLAAHKKDRNYNALASRSCLSTPTRRENPRVFCKTMITVLIDDCNAFSQASYDSAVDSLQLHMVECTCGKKGSLIRYGHYHRRVKYLSDLLDIAIQRVLCSECGVTHALIPSPLVPYSQMTLDDQLEVLRCSENGSSADALMEKNILIDENNVKHIIRQFRRHWKQRVLSLGLSLTDALTVPCLQAFSRQFMQIHRTPNILCSITSIA